MILKSEAEIQKDIVPTVDCKNCDLLVPSKFTLQSAIDAHEYLSSLNDYYQKSYDMADKRKNNKLNYLNQHKPVIYKKFYNNYYNEHLADIAQKVFEKEKNKILIYNHHLVQEIDPVYLDPRVSGYYDFRSHFYAPRKHFMGKFYDTFWFNAIILWAFTLLLYLTLYFEVLKNLLDLPEKIRSRRK